jgi:hypothetical protein
MMIFFFKIDQKRSNLPDHLVERVIFRLSADQTPSGAANTLLVKILLTLASKTPVSF